MKGPAEITAQKDGLSALGKPLATRKPTWVRRGKVMPFETSGASAAKIVLKKEADFWIDTGRVGVKIWRSVADELFAPNTVVKRVVVVGATDSGKSTLSTYLLNTALSKGLSAGVVDEDVGQGDLAPPGCVGGAVLQTHVFDLRDVEADLLGFVGAISPVGVEDVVRKEVSLVAQRLEASGSSFTVINTDGYISSEGVVFKAKMINDLHPDAVVCFEDHDGGQTIFNELSGMCGYTMVLAKHPSYSVKTRSERAVRRMSQYHRFLKGEHSFRIPLQENRIRFLGQDYHSNAAETGSSNRFAKIGSAGRSLVIERGLVGDVAVVEQIADAEKVVLPASSLNGMLLGLGSADRVLRFGRCVRVRSDFSVDVVTESVAGVNTVFLSLIRLREGLRREDILPIARSTG
ncbi:MAG: hypothetical protein M1387_11510 [Thaumarchaeota archaeon]|nr:hypothetical protein [Nitrososphaerota archaeon]